MENKKSYWDLLWSLSDNLSQQLINFVVGIILARLLNAEDFGLTGIVLVFITLSSLIVDGGFSAALINRKDKSNVDYNTVFYTNLILSIVIYTVFFFSAELIANFFEEPNLLYLLRLAGLNIIFLALSSIHRTIFTINLDFKKISIISFIAVLVSAFVAIILAKHNYGVYSLIIRILAGEVITIILFWLYSDWRPKWMFSVKSFKEMFSYGINLLLVNFLNNIQINMFYFIIGKFYSTVNLGYYTRSVTFRDLASINISNTFKRVSFATISRLADIDMKVEKFLFFRSLIFLLSNYLTLILFFCSKEIIIIVLSDKWESSIWILKYLSISIIFITMYNVALDFLAAVGTSSKQLKVEIIGKVILVPMLMIGFYFGFDKFIIAIVIQSAIMYVISLMSIKQLVHNIVRFDAKYIIQLIILFSLSYIIFSLIEVGSLGVYISFFLKFSVISCLFFVINSSLIFKLIKKRI